MGENIYDDIDFCLNTLYESIYNTKTEECFMFNIINKKDIVIDDLKKNNEFNYSKVLSGKIEKMGIYNDRLHYKIKNSIYPYTIEIGFINNKYTNTDQKRPELYNVAMMYMGSELVFEEKFNHILLPIMCFDIKKEKLEKIIPTLEKDFGKLYQSNNDNMYIIITEHFFKMYTLKEYLDENIDNLNENDLNNILFQIYITLGKLNERFNKFRHNKLNLESIRLYLKEPRDDIYKFDKEIYTLKNNKIIIKITDFDYSYNTGDYIQNNNPFILLNNANIDNPYYDIHYITNLIYLYLKNNKSENAYKLFKYYTNFFNEIIPEKYRIQNLDNYYGLDQEKYMINSDNKINILYTIKKISSMIL
jgi:hypothetical protein